MRDFLSGYWWAILVVVVALVFVVRDVRRGKRR